jgi:uncharacterized protein YcbK (DUF882 family)
MWRRSDTVLLRDHWLRRFGVTLSVTLVPLLSWANPPRDATPAAQPRKTGDAARPREVPTEAPSGDGADKARTVRGGGQPPASPPREGGSAVQPAAPSTSRKTVPTGVLRLVRGTERLQLRVLDRRQQLLENTLPELTRFLRAKNGSENAIDARLVTLLAMVSDHFGGREITVTSGFRPYSPRQYTRHSNHNAGRAIDFAIRGVANETLRDFCRTFRNVGVGYYPNSAFVHLDVRETNAYWVDYAAPGQAPRYHRPESRDEADESAAEVEGVVSVDGRGGGMKAGAVEPPELTPSGQPAAKSTGRPLGGEHSVFQH